MLQGHRASGCSWRDRPITPPYPFTVRKDNIMNIKDIIALAKAGYKPGEIKELLELAVPEPEPEKEPEPEQKEPEPDYKAMYEESQKKLLAAQKANQRQPLDIPEEKALADILKDVFN